MNLARHAFDSFALSTELIHICVVFSNRRHDARTGRKYGSTSVGVIEPHPAAIVPIDQAIAPRAVQRPADRPALLLGGVSRSAHDLRAPAVPLHPGFRPRQVPSVSQLNRRIASERLDQLLKRLHRRLCGIDSAATLCIDGKALCVSPVSQDRDARSGHIPGGMARGFKLHAIVT